MPEIWKAIPGHADYEASSHGRIRSIDRTIWYNPSRRMPNGYKQWRRGKILKPALDSVGYLTVCAGKGNTQRVHVLVALAFHGPCPAGLETIHKDETKANNTPRNLKYGTRSENLKRCWDAGNRA